MPSSDRTSPARTVPRSRAGQAATVPPVRAASNGHATGRPVLAAVPDAPAPPPEGSRRVPGSTDWAYIAGDAVWRFVSGRWVKQLAWCPGVADAVRYPAQDGRTITRSFKITVGDQTEVVSAGDLVRGAAWPKFAIAAGFTGRVIADVLVNIVTDQASQLPDVIGYPYFHEGLLRLPPADYLPDGYTRGEGSTLAALSALVAAVAPYPVAALQMGLSAVAPWVGGLQSQPFTLHVVGDSTVGKSTALYACASLWGTGYRRVAPPWAGTKIGIPGSFRDLGVLPAFRDELGSAGLPPSDRAALFTTIMEGCRRTARTRDDLARPSASWESVCFSTGNIAAVPASHASAGTPKGLIEIHADRTRPVIPAEAKACVRQLTNAPEVAGAWVSYATRLPLDGVRAEVERAGKDLGDPDADGLEWHMWRAMSLALAGARILAGVTGVPGLAVSAELATREVIAATADRLAEIGADHGARLAETVAEMIDAHPAAFGLDPDLSPRIEQVGFIAHAQDGAELICIYPNRHADIARRAEVEDAMTALRQLRDSGQLRTTKGKGLRYGAWRNNRTVHVYAYDLRTETGGKEGKGGKSPGQSVGEPYPLGGKGDPGQGVRGPEMAPLEPPADDDGQDHEPAPPAALAWPAGSNGEAFGAPAGPEPEPAVADMAAPGPPEPPFAGDVRAYLADCAGAAGLDRRYHPTADGAVKMIAHHGRAEAEMIRAAFACATEATPGKPESPAQAPVAVAPAPAPTEPPEPAQARPEPGCTLDEPCHRPECAACYPEPRPGPTRDDEREAFGRAVAKLGLDATDAEVTAALGIWHEVTGGVRWVSYAGQVGQAWFAKLAGQYASMKAPAPLASERAREVAESGPFTRVNYVAKPGRVIRPGRHHVTAYDLNGQHAAAAGSADLGDGEPEHVTSPRALGGLVNLPGYVLLSKALRTGHPAFGPNGGTIAAGTWIAMPLVKFLAGDLGLTVPAAEVLYWPRKGRRLSVYVDRYRQARDKLMKAEQTVPVRVALAVLKYQANAFIGMFHSETYSHGGFYRPDWYDMIVSTAEANALRAIAKCKTAPVAKMADTAYWVADDCPYRPEGLTVSAQLGKWKLDRHGPVTEDFITAVKDGPAAVRDAVIRIDAGRRAGQ
jgi:hypothetical protein